VIPDADEIEPPVQISDLPRCGALPVTDEEAVLAALREREHTLAVRRPVRGADAALELGQLGRLAAGKREEPRLRLSRAGREEEQPLRVRREARARVDIAARDLLGTAPRHRHAPEPDPVLTFFDRAPCVDRGGSVGGNRDLPGLCLPQDVLRGKTLHHGAIMA